MKDRAVSRSAFSRAAAAGIAPEAAMFSAYPAMFRGSHSSNSARVMGRSVSSTRVSSTRVSSASVTVLSKPAGLGLW